MIGNYFLRNLPEYLMVITAYFFMFIAVPFWLRGYRFSQKSTSNKIISTFIFSNITVMFCVYLLVLLGIYHRLTLILLLLSLCVGYRHFINPEGRGDAFTRFLYHLKNLSDSVELPYVMLKNMLNKLKSTLLLIVKKITNPIAFAVTVVIFGFRMYLTGYHSLNNMFYGTSDMYLHTQWIKYMQMNQPFSGGVYPMGFHCVVLALSDVFGFNIVTVMRMMGPIIGFFLLLSLYFLLRRSMRSYFAVNVVLFLLVVLELFPNWATERHFLALPQEYGAIFLYLCAYHFWFYLKEVKILAFGGINEASFFFESYDLVDIESFKRKQAWYRIPYGSPKWNLVHFAVTFALTLLIHPFITIFTIMLCGMIFITHILYLNWQAFTKLLGALMIGIVIAILPLTAGLLKGIPLNNSFLWAASVVTGSEGLAETTGGAAYEAYSGEVSGVVGHVYTSLTDSGILNRHDDLDALWLFPVLFVFLLSLVAAYIPYKKRQRSEIFAAFALYSLMLLSLFILSFFNIFAIMEYSRLYAFFIYSLPLSLAVLPELFHTLFYDDPKKPVGKIKMTAYLCLIAIISVTGFWFLHSQYGFNRLQRVSMMQFNGAVASYYQINKEFPQGEWLIISSFVEYPQILSNGYHYQIAEFVFKLEDPDADEPLIIDTENIFIYITKKANEYHYLHSLVRLGEKVNLLPFNPVWAEIDLFEIAEGREPGAMYHNIFLNGVLQAKADAWVQEYKKHFPAELSIFYDDDDITVYHLKQNIFEPNDLRLN